MSIGIGIGVDKGQAAFDSEAQSIIDSFTGTYTQTQRQAINDLVVGIKDLLSIRDLNDKFDTLYMLAAANTNDAGLNWANLASNTLTEVNNPTFTAFRGYTGNGTNMSLDTNYTPSTDAVNYKQNDASLFSYSRSNINALEFDFCSNDDTNNLESYTAPRFTDLFIGKVNTTAAVGDTVANTDSRGLALVQRIDASNIEGYMDGVRILQAARGSTGLAPNTFKILKRGESSVFSNRQISLAGTACKFTQSENLSLYNLFQTYLTVIGAQV
jgi:hypothetical protein